MSSYSGRAAALALIVLLGATARAGAATLNEVLYSSPTPLLLRDHLAEYARHAPSPAEAATAHLRRGESFDRGAAIDSAIACFRLAAEGGASDARIALVDALLRRRADGDIAEATAVLESALAESEASGDPAVNAYHARLAWAAHLSGHNADAVARFVPLSTRLGTDPTWRYRLAKVAFAAGDTRGAYDLIRPLLLTSRRRDAELVTMLGQIGAQSGRQRLLSDDVADAMARHDALERIVLQSMHARRVRFPAGDAEYVSAIVLERPAQRRPVAALIVMAPGDSVADYDSLTVSLRAAGNAVMLIEPRGTGWSVSANCPSPDTWVGREELLEARVANDVVHALDALRSEMPIDTSRALVVGVGAMAPVAVQAAQLDSRFRAIALISPAAAWVERGALFDRMRQLGRPLFLQAGAEDRMAQAYLDTLYATAPPRQSRFSESRRVGSGIRQFGGEPGVCTRFARWAAEATALRRPSRSPQSSR